MDSFSSAKVRLSFVGVLLRSLLLPNLDSNSEKEGSSLESRCHFYW